MLGLNQNELLDNQEMQRLLTQHNQSKGTKVNTLIRNDKKGGEILMVSNFQALIDKSYSLAPNGG